MLSGPRLTTRCGPSQNRHTVIINLLQRQFTLPNGVRPDVQQHDPGLRQLEAGAVDGTQSRQPRRHDQCCVRCGPAQWHGDGLAVLRVYPERTGSDEAHHLPGKAALLAQLLAGTSGMKACKMWSWQLELCVAQHVAGRDASIACRSVDARFMFAIDKRRWMTQIPQAQSNVNFQSTCRIAPVSQ